MTWLLAGWALAMDCDVRYSQGAPPPLSTEYGRVDLPDLTIVRPLEPLRNGLDDVAFDEVVIEALAGREEVYDFAVVVHSARVPTAFAGAAAFHLTYNNTDVEGTGNRVVSTPGIPVQAGLWMNHLDYWDSWGEANTGWVFAHEMGHQWLSFARFLDGVGDTSRALLGRQNAHWSYFMETGNSPMEGNAWVDNGDGTFTTDLDVDPAFSELDLYMMGMLEADQVEDFFVLTDVESSSRRPESGPEHLWHEEPVTVTATPLTVRVDDIIDVHGLRAPGPGSSQRDFRLLMVLVLNATETVEQSLLDRAYERQEQWVAAWDHYLDGASTVSFALTDEGFSPPRWDDTPLIPKAAR